VLTERMPHLVIPQNSIVFVSMRQVLCYPIHRGSLRPRNRLHLPRPAARDRPTGRPGFQGALGCPLHNISNEDIQMRLDEPFAKIDFVKTVPRTDAVTAQWKGIADAGQLEQWLKDNPASNVRLFKGGKAGMARADIRLHTGQRPTSSVHDVTRSLSRFRRAGWVGAISVLVAVTALVLSALALTDGLSSTKQELQRSAPASTHSKPGWTDRLTRRGSNCRPRARSVRGTLMIIAFEGLPGGGKTTTAQLLAARLKAACATESTHNHPFLDSVYRDDARHDLEVELAFLLLHASAWRAIEAAGVTVTDFTPVRTSCSHATRSPTQRTSASSKRRISA